MQLKPYAFGLAILFVFSSGSLAAGALAQPGPATDERQYDPATETTLTGTVTAIERPTSRRGGGGVHVMVKSPNETISVHLGPAWFLDEQQMAVKVGDAISVKGSRISSAGKPAIVAASVTAGGRTLVLRDSAGRPVWAGQQPRRP
ncbi:hypothetical protein D3C86_1487870 [compost metagenome]